MKKITLLILVGVLFGVFAIGTQAVAFSFRFPYYGPLFFKISDFADATLYPGPTAGPVVGVANVNALPQLGPTKPFGGEDAWAIFKVTDIITLDGSFNTLWHDLDNGEELTGMYYGIEDFYVNMPVVGGGEIDAAGIPGGGGLNGGINFEVYLDPTPDFTSAGGPLARVSQNVYPTVTDGALFLSGVLTAGQIHTAGQGGGLATEFHEILISQSPFVGVGNALIELTGGSHLALFDYNGPVGIFPLGGVVGTGTADFFATINSNATPPIPFGWTAFSNDPIHGFSPIPEPATMLLLGSGLIGLAGFARRRFKK